MITVVHILLVVIFCIAGVLLGGIRTLSATHFLTLLPVGIALLAPYGAMEEQSKSERRLFRGLAFAGVTGMLFPFLIELRTGVEAPGGWQGLSFLAAVAFTLAEINVSDENWTARLAFVTALLASASLLLGGANAIEIPLPQDAATGLGAALLAITFGSAAFLSFSWVSLGLSWAVFILTAWAVYASGVYFPTGWQYDFRGVDGSLYLLLFLSAGYVLIAIYNFLEWLSPKHWRSILFCLLAAGAGAYMPFLDFARGPFEIWAVIFGAMWWFSLVEEGVPGRRYQQPRIERIRVRLKRLLGWPMAVTVISATWIVQGLGGYLRTNTEMFLLYAVTAILVARLWALALPTTGLWIAFTLSAVGAVGGTFGTFPLDDPALLVVWGMTMAMMVVIMIYHKDLTLAVGSLILIIGVTSLFGVSRLSPQTAAILITLCGLMLVRNSLKWRPSFMVSGG